MKPPRDLSAHVAFEATPARLERQWQAVRERTQPSRKRARTWMWIAGATGIGAAVTAVLFAVLAGGDRSAPTVAQEAPLAGTRLTSGDDQVQVALRDGTEIALAPRSLLEVSAQDRRGTRWRIARGGAVFDVPHQREGRRFVVSAEDVEVVVIGTRFSVAHDPSARGVVEVSVERGIVEVRRGSMEPRRLRAGESLRVAPEARSDETREGPNADAPSDRPVRRNRARRPSTPEPAPPEPTVWERATEARRAGRAREAADAYEQYLRENPRGTQSALAAFELGRLRMDQLGDPRGATSALRQALRIAPRAPFAEDAQARVVQSAQMSGQLDLCREAREDYLNRYASGVHRRAVERACP